MKKLSVAISCVTLTLCVLSGCNDDKKDDATSAAGSTKATSTAQATADGAVKPAKAAATGVKAADLKPEHNKQIVATLNEICPDTHCEGEFNWDFKTFEHKSGKCTLAFVATSHTSKKKYEDEVTFDFEGEVIDGEGQETESFTDALNEAIMGWEMKHR